MSHEREQGSHPLQEEDRVRSRGAVLLILFSLAVIGGGIWWAWGLLGSELARERPGFRQTVGPPGEERHEAPHRVGEVLQGPIGESPGESGDLERWGWADREHRYARIPIERAMELVAQGQGGKK